MTLLEHTFHKHLNLIFEIKDSKDNIELFSKKYGINDTVKIQNIFQRFNRVLPKLKNKDIFTYESLNDLESIINVDTNSEKKREIKSKGSEKVYENDKCVVYYVKTFAASHLLGKGTKWCISGNNGEYDFINYNKEYNIYFVFDKNSDNKYAVGIDKDGDIGWVYDELDTRIKYSELNTYRIPKSVYKPKEFNIQDCIDGKIIKNSDGSFDVEGDVNISDLKLTKIPVKFGRVKGNFYCENNQLITLENSPKEVGGYFNCDNNKLISLESAPKKVGGDFYCGDNPIKDYSYDGELGGKMFK